MVKIQKIKALGLVCVFAFSIMFVNFVLNVNPIIAQAASTCQIKLFWQIGETEYDATQTLPSSGNSVKVGTAYKATAQFDNCNTPIGGKGRLRISAPGKENLFEVALDRTQKSLTQPVVFDTQGSYQIFGYVIDASGVETQESSVTMPITVTPVGGSTPTPTPVTGGPTPTPGPNGGGGGTVGMITNPISFNSLGALIVGVIKFLMTMLGALAVLFIIIGAVRMVASAGNESAVKAGKSTVTWAVIGLAVALLSFSFISLLQSVLGRN